MPRGDKTGPQGLGQMTGRRMGLCVGNDNPGFFTNSGFGRGMGRQFRSGNRSGIGRGFFRGGNISETPSDYTSNKGLSLENEIKLLKEKISFLETKISGVNKE
jgi:hypothetical protein